MVRFIHTSDWQIGMKGGGLGEAGEQVAEQRIETIDRILKIAEEQDADFVVVAGDAFEDNRVSYSDVDRVARIIRAHSDVILHVIPGNHDLPGPGSVWNRIVLRGVPNLRVYLNTDPVEIKEGVVLHPFPVFSRYSGTDPLSKLPDLARINGIHVAIAHGHITTVAFGKDQESIGLPIDPSHVARSGLDYLALGHWHGTKLIDAHGDRCHIAYSGTHEQTTYDEIDAGNILLVEIEEKGALPRVEVIHSGKLRWGNEQLEFVEDETLDRLERLLSSADYDLLQLELSGELPESLYPEYQQLLEASRSRFLDLRIRDDKLRWRTDSEVPLSFTDASLDAVLHKLHESSEAGIADPATVREALRLLGEFAKEAGL